MKVGGTQRKAESVQPTTQAHWLMRLCIFKCIELSKTWSLPSVAVTLLAGGAERERDCTYSK